MTSALEFLTNGEADHASVCESFSSIEVEESVDLPGAMEITLPLDATNGRDLTYLAEAAIQPYASISLVATAKLRPPECIFDGYVLSHKIHLDTGTTNSSVKVWCQDASWLLNLEERVREWTGQTDTKVAAEIFKEYGITPADENTSGSNSEEDSAPHAEPSHTLMQRETDLQLLKRLARRSGKLCRVVCADRPDKRWGYFARPNLEADASVALILNPSAIANVQALDFEWDVARPRQVARGQAFFYESAPGALPPSENKTTQSSGLRPLGKHNLTSFIQPQFLQLRGRGERVPQALLMTIVDNKHDLEQRAKGMLRESEFFVKCKGEADLSQLNIVLRAGMIVDVQGAGSVHSGKYYVWSVRHSIGANSHKMNFVLVRNAVGTPPTGGA